ncbi:HAD family hydrolase [Sulfobacillus thermosulfidooxidans]|uniref:HAD family hydrolase n=1 Tax=Sulfobacillus thermosulfidooxidans TaxID=28034 RepID=UPI00096BA65E|nr:HAD family hydrolase [Sulfobacillus thermosulfidooxidans]OLZ09677.1 sucrose-phosphate phosphatase [Sulfobacillus thermosulfidooxidans]OLZ16016.1 sucrose-phosphate phosphatase [Sulfobacillus thermosulfidooxidans]OLZ18136.1 sucrose-phosphate phosphatase [Sulfobacillus thermosulfidooxidans]
MAAIKRVLATDIDGTLIGHGGEQAVRDYLLAHPELGVIYLTGRTLNNACSIITRYGFPTPLAIATDVGADIYWGPHFEVDEYWAFEQRRHWSPRRLRTALSEVSGVIYRGRSSHWRVAFELQDPSLLPVVKSYLTQHHLTVRMLWHPNESRLDILPCTALKSRALQYILRRIGIKSQNCFVAGDAENDGDMLVNHYPGVLVANGDASVRNCLPEWIVRSRYPGALGVLDGLQQWLEPQRQ